MQPVTYSMRATENRDILDGGTIERRDPKNTFMIYENKTHFYKQQHIFAKNVSTRSINLI